MSRGIPEGYRFDEAAFPLVVATFRGPATMERALVFFSRLDVWCRDGRRFAVIVDVSGGGAPTAAHRKLLADSFTSRQHALARQCLGIALVFTSPFIRGAATAVLWMYPPAHSIALVASLAEARDACAQWFAIDRLMAR